MIRINGAPADPAVLAEGLPEGGPERAILRTLSGSAEPYFYDSQEQLRFELSLRREIIRAANALSRSGMTFEVFRESRCNEAYWTRGLDGGFGLKAGVKPSDAVRDIFRNGAKYGTECATAMVIVYYGALLGVFSEEDFNRIFRNIYLMNWHRIHRALREIGVPRKFPDYLPGDRRYFSNPDVNPETPEWQGENVIDVGNGLYYGHGMGRRRAGDFIRALNGNRREDADREAYLMDNAGRPDFKRLFALRSGSEAGAFPLFRTA